MAEKIRVLYVDDESDLLDLTKMYLEQADNFIVTTVLNAPNAIKLLEKEKFDAIVSDYQMPVMDGIQFLVCVRTRFGSIPFILFTGKGREEVVIQAINSGADFYLQKGGDPLAQFAELSHKIKSAASRKRAEDSLQKSEAKYRHLIEHADEAIVVVQDGMLKLVNHRMVELTGYSEQDLRSMSFSTFIHPDDRVMVMERYEKRMNGEKPPFRYAFRLSPKDASTRWVEISVVVIDWDGRPATLNFLTDITERKRAEDALRTSEEKFRKAFFTSPDSICITRLSDGMFVSINKGFTEITGYTEEDVAGKTSLEINVWKDPEDRKKIIEGLQANGEVRNYEAQFLTKTGEIYGSMSTSIIELNGVPHILNITHDITARKRAEEELKKNAEELHASYEELTAQQEELHANFDELTRQEMELKESKRELTDIIEFLPDATLVIDKNGTVLAWNRAMVEMTGVPAEQILGKGNYECALPFYHERRPITVDLVLHDDPAVVAKYPVINKEGGSLFSEIFIPHLNKGRGAFLWFMASPIYDTAGNITGAIESIRDITDRKVAEEAIRTAGDTYRNIFLNSQIGLFRTDMRTGLILDANDTVAWFIGYQDRASLLSEPFNIAERYVDPYDREKIISLLQADGEFRNYEARFLKNDGSIIWMRFSARLVREKGWIEGVSEDITERKRMEEEAKKAHEELAASYEQITATEEELRQTLEQLTEHEQNLRESEEKYRTVFENTGTAMVVIEESSIISLSNNGFAQLTGFSKDDIEGKKSWTEFVVKEDLERMLAQHRLRRQNREKALTHYEFRFITKTGDIRTIYLTIDMIPGTTKSVASLMDITVRKLIEDELREQERIFRTLIGNLPGFVYRCANDHNWTMNYISDGCREITGYAPDDFVGNKTLAFNDIIHPEFQKTLWDKWQNLLDKKEVFEEEYPIITKTGETRQVWERGRGIFSEAGRLLYLEGFITDITERKRTEEALRASEERYRALFNDNPIMLFTLDAKGKVISVNYAGASQLGYTVGELEGQSVLKVFYPDDHRAVTEQLQVCLKSPGEEFHWQFRKVCKNGSLIWVDEHARTIPGLAEGLHVLVVCQDITDRKQVEDALRKSEKKYRDIIDKMQDVVYRTDREGKLIMFSPHGVKLAGYDSEEEMIGFDVALDTYLNPEERERFLAALKETGSVDNYPLVLKARYGIPRQVIASSHFYYDDEGNVLGVEGILHDVTDIRKKEQELRTSEERYRTLYNDNPIMLFTLDSVGNVISVNHAGASQLGYTAGELEGQSVLKVFYPDDHRAVTEQLQICLKSPGEEFHWQFRKVQKDGSLIWVDEHARAISSSSGDLSVLVVCQDITERKRAEEALRQANKKLNLLSGITRHDILNQLMALKGYLELSRNYLDDKKTLVDFLEKEETAARTIEEQIMFTRDYQELGAAAPAWQNVNEGIRNAMVALPMRAVHVEADPADPEVYADPLFDKVFYNLIDNALRYGGDQMKMIRVSSQESDTSLEIVCEDDGVGITDEDKKKLFRKGFGKHTGLALFLSRKILAITGITITENGVPGKGARFEIVVPKGAYRFTGNRGH